MLCRIMFYDIQVKDIKINEPILQALLDKLLVDVLKGE